MLKVSQLNDWLGVLTNVGVIIGLGFVIYEIQQNNVSMDRDFRVYKSEVRAGTGEAIQQVYTPIIENQEVADIWLRGLAGEKLEGTDAERFRLLANRLYFAYRELYDQWTLFDGYSPDWVIEFYVKRNLEQVGLRDHFVETARGGGDYEFADRVLALDERMSQGE